MIVQTGKGYHIKEDYFNLVQDPSLMHNKGDKMRPTFFVFENSYYPGIYWAIPVSSVVNKYRSIVAKKIQKYGKCETIVIAKYAGRESAFLIQNIFPVIPKFVDHEHTTRNGTSYYLDVPTKNLLIKYATDCLQQYKRGDKSIIYTHINDDYLAMIDELEKDIKH